MCQFTNVRFGTCQSVQVEGYPVKSLALLLTCHKSSEVPFGPSYPYNRLILA